MIPYRKTVWASSIFLFVAGCSGGNGGSPDSGSGNAVPQAVPLRGHVHGGQSPVASSAVTLYTVNPGAAATVVTTALTDGKGDFTLNFTCTSPGLSNSSLLYITSNGGNPGGGNNDALSEMVALGACGNLPAFADVTEVTTVAAAYALSGFMMVSGTAPNLTVNVQASSTNTTGIANAFATADELADPATGQFPAALATSQAAAQQRINTLANSVAACVNTTGAASAQCGELFQCALPSASFDSGSSSCSGGTGTVPGDTLSAALSVAHNAGIVSITGVYDAATKNVVFSPALVEGAPTDWTMQLIFTGGGLYSPTGIAIDASGDVWVANNGNYSVTELNSSGAAVAGSPFTGGGLHNPYAIAIDASGDVWVTNNSGNSVTKLDSTGAAVAGSPFRGGGLSYPRSIAIDASGNAWVPNQNTSSVTELSSNGTAVASSPFSGGGLDSPVGIAIDASGNAWVANEGSYSVSKLNSSGQSVPGSPFTGGGLFDPDAVAIDVSGNVWVANTGGSNSITELKLSGSPVVGSPYTGGGLSNPGSIAIDGSGNVWVVSESGNSITELDSSGAVRTPGTGISGTGFSEPTSAAIDASGNVWAANNFNSTVTELVGAAAPTRTPLVATITPGQGFAP